MHSVFELVVTRLLDYSFKIPMPWLGMVWWYMKTTAL